MVAFASSLAVAERFDWLARWVSLAQPRDRRPSTTPADIDRRTVAARVRPASPPRGRAGVEGLIRSGPVTNNQNCGFDFRSFIIYGCGTV
jgi:hypothetical protein